MNFTRQPFASKERRDNNAQKNFHLSLKKTRIQDRGRESSKENNPRAANERLDIHNYRNIDLCISDSSSPDSQNYNLRLSESANEITDLKTLPSYYEHNNSTRVKGNTDGTVLISDSTDSGSSNSNSPRKYGEKKPRVFTPFYRNAEKNSGHPTDIIVLESSVSEDDREFETKKESEGFLSLLDSDDDSVLKSLKINPHKSVNNSETRSEKSEFKNRIIEASPSFSSGSTDNISNDYNRQAEYKNTDFTSKYRRTPSNASSSGSGSTCFSPGADIVLGSDLSHEFKITSESSSRSNKALPEHSSGRKTKGNTSCKSSNSKSLFWYNKRAMGDDDTRKDASGERNFGNVTCRSSSKCGIKTDNSVRLTKKDAQRIIKGVKLPGNSHWTPKVDSPYFKLESESLSQREEKNDGINGRLIDETKSELLTSESSSDDEIITTSTKNLLPGKTHVSRFMNTPHRKPEISGLSERKKTDISKWLMNNTPGSSSSSSVISESNRNSSFGNSSLERFELKHETPNNRGKLSKPGTSEKVNSVPSATDRFIYRGKTSVLKNQTPVGACNLEKKKIATNQTMTPTFLPKPTEPVAKKSLPIVTAVKDIHIEDCADILDKLYGNVWRSKADAVLTPTTEPKARKNITNKRQSKTERKYRPMYIKGEIKILSSSEDDEFGDFAKNIRPNFNSTKKKHSRDSFINDKSASENSSESFYYTALTNPRESKGITQLPKPTLASASTIRAIAICDSDSDSESNSQRSLAGKLNRKRLSFSEDSSDTSTSEFDPGELVLPKTKTKKAPAKKHQQAYKSADDKTLLKNSVKSGDKKTRSFLASLSATVPIQNCHPEARVYRDNYKNKKDDLCKYLFKLYNKEIFEDKLPNDMPIEWNVRMRGTAGFCYNKKSVKALGGIVRSSRIVLATKILDTPDRLRDTLVHEMCHAAAWLINNVSDGHGPYWKGWASKAIKTFPELPPIKRCHDYKIKTKFTYKCMSCGYSIGRHSKSLNVERKRCGLCFGKFELLINRTTRSGTMQVATPVQTRTPTGFALFVKENYHSVKKDRRSIKHAEVMKILGQQFSAVKIAKKSTDIDAI